MSRSVPPKYETLEPCVIPALPGYFYVSEVQDTDGCFELSYQPIVAWIIRPALRTFQFGHDEMDLSDLTPVPVGGIIYSAQNTAIKDPFGIYHWHDGRAETAGDLRMQFAEQRRLEEASK